LRHVRAAAPQVQHLDGARGGETGSPERNTRPRHQQGVFARAAMLQHIGAVVDQHVVARAGAQGIGAGPAIEAVGAAVAEQDVGGAVADGGQVADAGQGQTFLLNAQCVADTGLDGIGAGIGQGLVDLAGGVDDIGIVARIAAQGIAAETAGQAVVAGAANQDVVAIATDEDVVARAAVERVVAGCAVETVVAAAPCQPIVAGQA
jgi:hypothetical protein